MDTSYHFCFRPSETSFELTSFTQLFLMVMHVFIHFVASVFIMRSLGNSAQNFSHNQAKNIRKCMYLRLVNPWFTILATIGAFHSVNTKLKVYKIAFFDFLDTESRLNCPNYRGEVLLTIVAMESQFYFPSAGFDFFSIVKLFLWWVTKTIAVFLHFIEVVFHDLLAYVFIVNFFITFRRNFQASSQL